MFGDDDDDSQARGIGARVANRCADVLGPVQAWMPHNNARYIADTQSDRHARTHIHTYTACCERRAAPSVVRRLSTRIIIRRRAVR